MDPVVTPPCSLPRNFIEKSEAQRGCLAQNHTACVTRLGLVGLRSLGSSLGTFPRAGCCFPDKRGHVKRTGGGRGVPMFSSRQGRGGAHRGSPPTRCWARDFHPELTLAPAYPSLLSPGALRCRENGNDLVTSSFNWISPRTGIQRLSLHDFLSGPCQSFAIACASV